MAVERERRRFTVDEYYQMVRVGILREDDRVELIEGEIVEMSSIGRRHAACVYRLTDTIARQFLPEALLGVQGPLRLSDGTEPQPDLMLLRRKPDLYDSGPPVPADVLLLVEVGDTTIGWDRRVKLPLYAGCGIQEVWLVDLEQDVVAVYTDPAPDRYQAVRVAHRGERIAPTAFPDRAVAIEDILPTTPDRSPYRPILP